MPDSHYIGLIAQNRGGKETISKVLEDMFGPTSVRTVRFSDPMGECLETLRLEPSRENYQTISTITREAFGQDLYAKILYERALALESDFVVIDGNRRPEDIEAVRRLPGAVVIYIEAPRELRYQWMVRQNNRPGDAEKTMEEFIADDEQESNHLIPSLKPLADDVVMNDTDDPSFAHLREQLGKLAKKYSWKGL